MRIKLIVAASTDGYIGKPDGNLPFRLKEDMIRFKALTKGHPVVMGRKTFDSLPFMLPYRDHFIITANRARYLDSYSSKNAQYKDTLTAHVSSFLTLQHQLNRAAEKSNCDYSEVWIIGGGEIYKQALEFLDIDRIELTRVHTTFPEANNTWARFELPEGWEEMDSRLMQADSDNEHEFSFITYKKVK